MNRRDIDLSVPPETAWAALVAAGPRHWYYETELRGELRPGAPVAFVQGDRHVEEAEVLEVDAPARLVLRTRFVFAPQLAEGPPVVVTWRVEPAAAGCTVALEWEGEGASADLLASGAAGMLAGLRLALDPGAQREIERLPEIGEIEIRDVTPDRVGDYQRFFDLAAFRDYPAWQSCYCMHAIVDDDREWAERTGAQNRAAMSERLREGRTSALLAYAGDEPVGWCHWGTDDRVPALLRHSSAEADPRAGHVACFIVAAPYRGHGVARALLDAALARMRSAGLEYVQAYPGRDRRSPQSNFRGPLAMYEAAGFETHRELPRHLIVRKSLA